MIVFERCLSYSNLYVVLFVGAVADRYYITCVSRPLKCGSCRGLIAGGKPRLKVYTWLP